MTGVRIVLIALGTASIGMGGWLLVTTQQPGQLLGVVVWLAAAVLVHDGVLVPLVSVIRAARRRSRRQPPR